MKTSPVLPVRDRLDFAPLRRARGNRSLPLAGCIAAGLLACVNLPLARALDGTWTGSAGNGLWSLPGNWMSNVADGLDFTAEFGTLNITGLQTVHLDTPRTIGNLTFGDADPLTAGSWLLDGNANASNVLTLAVTANQPAITVNALAAAEVATISAPLVSELGVNKAGTGTLVLNGAGTYGGTFNVGTGTLRLDTGGVMTTSAITVASGGSRVFQVNGGSLTANGLVSVNATNVATAAGLFLIDAGTVQFNGGWRTNGDAGATLRINGGTVTATDINVQRNAAALSFTSGFIVTGGTTTVGTIGLGTSNSWGAMSIEGGSLTATGPITIGSQATSGRGGGMRVTNGTFVSTDTAVGIVLGKTNSGGNTNNVASATFTGGTSTVEKFTLGFDDTVNAGSSTISVNGGTLYIGSGGIVRNAAAGLTASATFTAGVVGAKANWTATAAISTGTGTTNNVEIKAADAANVSHDITFAAPVSGSSGFTKTGGGKLILAADNTHTGGTGGTIISAGVLQVGNGGAAGTLGTGAVINNATLAFNRTGTLSVPNAISGTGTVELNGTGRVILTGPQTYSGVTTVNAGVLNIAGNLAGSPVTVKSGGTIEGIGTISGIVTIESAGKLAPGSGVGTITVGGLTLSTGAALDLEFNSVSAYDKVVVSNNNGLVMNGGSLRLLNENTSDPWVVAGKYNLFQYSGSFGGSGVSALSVANQAPGLTYTFGSSGGFVTLDIASSVIVPTWNITGGGSWSTAGNWTSTVPNAAGQTAKLGESITGAASITLDGSKTVGTVQFFNLANSYTIASGTGGSLILNAGAGTAKLENLAGTHTIASPVQLASNTEASVVGAGTILTISGAISGTGSLTNNGSGTLVLSGTNSYAGPTTLQAGILRIASNGALGTGTVSFAGNGTLQAGANALAPANGIVISSGATAMIDSAALDLTLGGIISDIGGNGRLQKLGTGKLILSRNNTYGGVTEVTAGVLSVSTLPNGGAASPIGQSASLPANLILNGGALEFTGPETTTDRAFTIGSAGGALIASGSGPITFSNPAAVAFSDSGATRTMRLSGTNTGANTMAAPIGNSTGGAVSLAKEGAGNWVLASPNTFSGTTTISGGTLTLVDPLALGGSLLDYNNQGGALVFSEALSSATLGGIRGGQALALATTGGIPLSLSVGANGQDATYSGVFSGAGSLTKIGAGVQSLSGNSTYTGATTVTAGTLRVTAAGALAGTTGLAVNSGGTFQVDGGNVAIAGPTNLGTGSNAGAVVVDSGTATFQQVTLANSDGSRFQVNGGVANLAGLTINRNNANGAFNASGFIVTGGETTTGSINLGTNNSWGTMQLSGGTVTNTGPFVVGNQVTANRGGRLRVTGGTLNSTGTEGLVLGAQASNVASAQFTGGTSSFEKISLVRDDTVTGVAATLTVDGGTVYLGSGGLVANTGGGSTATVLLSGGVLGATANWSTAVPTIELSNAAGGIAFQAGNAPANPRNITIDSVLSGSGGLRKTGPGTLTLGAQNSYSGTTLVEDGIVAVIGSLLATESIAISGGTLKLGASDRINNSTPVTLRGGVLSANGFNETIGTLTLEGNASFDLGTGASVVHFGDSKLSAWTGSLSITNWSGSILGGGADQLFFGTDTTGLSSSQLAKTFFLDPAGFPSGLYGAKLLATGELVVLPEPNAAMVLAAGMGLAALRRRRG